MPFSIMSNVLTSTIKFCRAMLNKSLIIIEMVFLCWLFVCALFVCDLIGSEWDAQQTVERAGRKGVVSCIFFSL